MELEFKDKTKNFDILIEECSELIQIISKIKRFGLDNYHPDTPNISNKEKLIQEMGDVLCLLEINAESNGITWEEVLSALDRKYNKLNKWY